MAIRVEKIGGDDAFMMANTLSLLEKRKQQGEKGVYVFSAMKDSINPDKKLQWNTTSILISIAGHIREGDFSLALQGFSQLKERYVSTIEKELSTHQKKQDIVLILETHFSHWQKKIEEASEGVATPNEKNDFSLGGESLMGFGEILTSHLYAAALWTQDACILRKNPLNILTIQEIIRELVEPTVEKLEQDTVVCLPWYVEWVKGGVISYVGRGYTDWMAAHIYSGLKSFLPDEDVVFAIRKMFALSSADPRIVQETKKLRHLSVMILIEMVDARWADAGFVNREAIFPWIFDNGGYIRIYSDADEEGTIVTERWPKETEPWIEFVQSKPVISFSIEGKNFQKPGYFKTIYTFFESRNISIDNIPSSGARINIILPIEKNLLKSGKESILSWYGELEQELKLTLKDFWGEEAGIEISKTLKYIVYVGGHNIDYPWMLAMVAKTLGTIGVNLGPIIQTDEAKVIAFWVDETHHMEAVKALHTVLVEEKIIPSM